MPIFNGNFTSLSFFAASWTRYILCCIDQMKLSYTGQMKLSLRHYLVTSHMVKWYSAVSNVCFVLFFFLVILKKKTFGLVDSTIKIVNNRYGTYQQCDEFNWNESKVYNVVSMLLLMLYVCVCVLFFTLQCERISVTTTKCIKRRTVM